jgi:hypothetical protein
MGVLFTLGLLLAAGCWCWPYVQAIAWHVQHGNAARFGEFQIPVAKWVRPDSGQGLRLDLRQGEFGYMEFELGRKVTPGEMWRAAWEANSKSSNPKVAEIAKHFLTLKSTQVMIADQPSFCVDDSLTIRCVPQSQERGLTVDFFGSPDLKPIFYQTLAKITRTQHN